MDCRSRRLYSLNYSSWISDRPTSWYLQHLSYQSWAIGIESGVIYATQLTSCPETIKVWGKKSFQNGLFDNRLDTLYFHRSLLIYSIPKKLELTTRFVKCPVNPHNGASHRFSRKMTHQRNELFAPLVLFNERLNHRCWQGKTLN